MTFIQLFYEEFSIYKLKLLSTHVVCRMIFRFSISIEIKELLNMFDSTFLSPRFLKYLNFLQNIGIFLEQFRNFGLF